MVGISLPYATFGLIVRDGVVVDAPPIARWTIGKPEVTVVAYYRRKGAAVAQLEERPVEAREVAGPNPADGTDSIADLASNGRVKDHA